MTYISADQWQSLQSLHTSCATEPGWWNVDILQNKSQWTEVKGRYYLFYWITGHIQKDVWRSSSWFLLLKHGEKAGFLALGLIRSWVISKDGYDRVFLKLFHCSNAPIFFAMFKWHIYVSEGSLPLSLSISTTEKSLAPSSCHLPFEYLYTLTGHSGSSLLEASSHSSLKLFL